MRLYHCMKIKIIFPLKELENIICSRTSTPHSSTVLIKPQIFFGIQVRWFNEVKSVVKFDHFILSFFDNLY